MDQKRRGKAEEIFSEMVRTPPEARQSFLDSACGQDSELRRLVEQLLADQSDQSGLTATETVTASMLGRQLGPYQIVGPLGAGGMGEVYRARDSKLGREVALKTRPAEFARDPERLARFRREARTLASLNHPNIAAIYGLEESGEVECLILELFSPFLPISGGTVTDCFCQGIVRLVTQECGTEISDAVMRSSSDLI